MYVEITNCCNFSLQFLLSLPQTSYNSIAGSLFGDTVSFKTFHQIPLFACVGRAIAASPVAPIDFNGGRYGL